MPFLRSFGHLFLPRIALDLDDRPFKRKPFNRRLLVPNLEARTYVDGLGRKIH
jgi:hypothetical protein